MTGRPVAARRPGRMRRARARAWRLVTALLGVPRIATARRVWSRYNAASGPLLARGLAFTTLFMLVPALLLIASIAGLVGGDLERRARIVDFLVAQFPLKQGLFGNDVFVRVYRNPLERCLRFWDKCAYANV